jgi:mannosyl-3-phosphoglycerate phosphatase
MVFTDLDGAFLDARAFSVDASRAVLRRIVSARIPLVPVTSRTFAEVRTLADALGIDGPFIIESGGGIARRVGSSWRMQACGADAASLRAAVPHIEERANARLLLYSTMRLDEAAAASGLTGIDLRRSMQRHFDEPFVVTRGSLEDVGAAAMSLGLRVRSGERLHRLCGPAGIDAAAQRIRGEVAAALGIEPIVVALGSTPMGAEFLSIADIPIIIPRSDGTPDPSLVAMVPDARIAASAGFRGWVDAIDDMSGVFAAQAGAS